MLQQIHVDDLFKHLCQTNVLEPMKLDIGQYIVTKKINVGFAKKGQLVPHAWSAKFICALQVIEVWSKGEIFNTCFAELKELIAQWDSLGVFFTQKYVVEHFYQDNCTLFIKNYFVYITSNFSLKGQTCHKATNYILKKIYHMQQINSLISLVGPNSCRKWKYIFFNH